MSYWLSSREKCKLLSVSKWALLQEVALAALQIVALIKSLKVTKVEQRWSSSQTKTTQEHVMSSVPPWAPAHTLFSFGSVILKLMWQIRPNRNLKAYMLSLKNCKLKLYFILSKRKKKIAAIIGAQSTFPPKPNLCQTHFTSSSITHVTLCSCVTCTPCNDTLRYMGKGQCPCPHMHPGN